MKARVLSKRQRERKINRRRLNEIMGDRLQNWRNFVKKDNDARMTEEERDRKEGDRLVDEYDEITGLTPRKQEYWGHRDGG